MGNIITPESEVVFMAVNTPINPHKDSNKTTKEYVVKLRHDGNTTEGQVLLQQIKDLEGKTKISRVTHEDGGMFTVSYKSLKAPTVIVGGAVINREVEGNSIPRFSRGAKATARVQANVFALTKGANAGKLTMVLDTVAITSFTAGEQSETVSQGSISELAKLILEQNG